MDAELKEWFELEFEKLKMVTWKMAPFFSVPLHSFPIKLVSDDVIETAAVTKDNWILINPKFLKSLKHRWQRAFVLFHEVLHILLKHHKRTGALIRSRRGVDRALMSHSANIAGDAIINHILMNDFWRIYNAAESLELVTFDKIWSEIRDKVSKKGITLSGIKSMAMEELAIIIYENMEVSKEYILYGDVIDEFGKGIDGETVFTPNNMGEIDDEYIDDVCERAEIIARQTGTVPGNLLRIVKKIREEETPWMIRLLSMLGRNGMDVSWKIPSRRGYDYPGVYKLGAKSIVLVDCSGSITEEELEYFLGLIQRDARRGIEVRVIPWDVEVYGDITVRRVPDVSRRVANMMKGGGGTRIRNALSYVYRLVGKTDAVIVLTDGYIHDSPNSGNEGSEDVARLSRMIANKAGKAIVAYLCVDPMLPGFKAIRVNFSRRGAG